MTHDPSQESLFALDVFVLATDAQICGFACALNFKTWKLGRSIKYIRFLLLAYLGLCQRLVLETGQPKSLQWPLKREDKSPET